MEDKIKQFCKDYKLKFEDFNINSSILVTSKICKSYKLKTFASKKECYKYRYFQYFYVIDYVTYIDCITIYDTKMYIDYIGAILTSNIISMLKLKIKNITTTNLRNI